MEKLTLAYLIALAFGFWLGLLFGVAAKTSNGTGILFSVTLFLFAAAMPLFW